MVLLLVKKLQKRFVCHTYTGHSGTFQKKRTFLLMPSPKKQILSPIPNISYMTRCQSSTYLPISGTTQSAIQPIRPYLKNHKQP